jgi:polyhydroxyalkanoate synthesis regulator phasin
VRLTKGTLLAIGAAVLAVAAGGGAIAATKLTGPKERDQAIINDAAGQLGVTPAQLSGALKKAVENQIDTAVKAGTITKAQGDALKARVEAGDLPLFGGPHRGFGGPGGPHGFFGHHGGPFARGLDTAATYLGLTEDQLHAALAGGKTLAQVAKSQGKTVDGLIAALTDDAKQRLDTAVKNGHLTQKQADQALKELQARITDLVNGRFPDRDHFEHRGFFRGGGAMPHPPAFRHA